MADLNDKFFVIEDFDEKTDMEELKNLLADKFGIFIEDATAWVEWCEDIAEQVMDIHIEPPDDTKMIGKPAGFPWPFKQKNGV